MDCPSLLLCIVLQASLPFSPHQPVNFTLGPRVRPHTIARTTARVTAHTQGKVPLVQWRSAPVRLPSRQPIWGHECCRHNAQLYDNDQVAVPPALARVSGPQLPCYQRQPDQQQPDLNSTWVHSVKPGLTWHQGVTYVRLTAHRYTWPWSDLLMCSRRPAFYSWPAQHDKLLLQHWTRVASLHGSMDALRHLDSQLTQTPANSRRTLTLNVQPLTSCASGLWLTMALGSSQVHLTHEQTPAGSTRQAGSLNNPVPDT